MRRVPRRKAEAVAAPAPSLWRVIRIGLSLGFCLLMIALTLTTIVLPKATGSTPLTVLTTSMEPGLPPGSLLIIRPVETNDIRIGDVVTYQIESGKPAVITHRVTEIRTSTGGTRSFTLKGDNNAEADTQPVIPAQIQGRLWYSLPLMGYASTMLSSGTFRDWAIPLAAGLMFLYAGYMIVTGTVGAIRARAKRRTARHAGE